MSRQELRWRLCYLVPLMMPCRSVHGRWRSGRMRWACVCREALHVLDLGPCYSK